MQTFLPYKSFTESAKALDSKRLNKQVLEGYQILKVLNNPDPRAAWRNHPAVKMWRGYEVALYHYIMAMIKEATMRGIKTDKNRDNVRELKMKTFHNWGSRKPVWYQNGIKLDRLTESHRANLYRKDPEYYGRFRDDKANPCCDKCQYYWVTHEEKNG
jgi:hypothetical protein